MEYFANTAGRAWLEVDEEALRHNLNVALTTGKKVMAVIKGNGYGVGAAELARRLEAFGCHAFGTACLDEAIELRKVTGRPILILAYTSAEEAKLLSQYDIVQTAVDLDHARQLNQAARDLGCKLKVHIKLDTGMSRFGILAQNEPGSAADQVKEILDMDHLAVEGIFTHFSMADMPERDSFTAWQLNNFNAVIREVQRSGIKREFLCHASNSAGILFYPEARFDMVRAGAMLFGVNPHGSLWEDGTLRQVLSFKARIAQVKTVPPGSFVSYGGMFRTERETKLAVIPVGFADGYIRNWSGRGLTACVNGVSCTQIGRICMDSCMFDVTGMEVSRGDVITLLGKGALSLDEAARIGGTNNMEPIILRGKRVPVRFCRSR